MNKKQETLDIRKPNHFGQRYIPEIFLRGHISGAFTANQTLLQA
jgi:hypothetical protein